MKRPVRSWQFWFIEHAFFLWFQSNETAAGVLKGRKYYRFASPWGAKGFMSLGRDTSQIHKTCVWIGGICWWLNGGALTSETHYRAGTTVSCFRLVSARSVPDQFLSSWFPRGPASKSRDHSLNFRFELSSLCPDLDHDTPRYTNFSRKCHQLPPASSSWGPWRRLSARMRSTTAMMAWRRRGVGRRGRPRRRRAPPALKASAPSRGVTGRSDRIPGWSWLIRWILVDFVGNLKSTNKINQDFKKPTIFLGICRIFGNLKIFDKLRTHHWVLPLKARQTGVLSGVRQGGRLVRCLCSPCQQWCCEARGLTWWSWLWYLGMSENRVYSQL